MDGAVLLRDFGKLFRMYKTLAEKAMAQVPTDAAFGTILDAESNSIAIIVQHIAGNLRSRYRDLLTTDGEKPDRDRDGEFEIHEPVTRERVLTLWNEGWAVALATLDSLTPDDLEKTITIRGEAFLVVEALNRSITHTAYHVGQIVFLARHLAPNWTSLSIPKGKSAEFSKGNFKGYVKT
ncbi:MAG TPA: DUF1572 family protein [Vicinamibacterales bacterium]|nr:DUF1572 family protein [Vicinamibacterales bacterium]